MSNFIVFVNHFINETKFSHSLVSIVVNPNDIRRVEIYTNSKTTYLSFN